MAVSSRVPFPFSIDLMPNTLVVIVTKTSIVNALPDYAVEKWVAKISELVALIQVLELIEVVELIMVQALIVAPALRLVLALVNW